MKDENGKVLLNCLQCIGFNGWQEQLSGIVTKLDELAKTLAASKCLGI